jgi:tripartite-type tricarboxylate transporter receptor subunit TctC
MKKAASSRARRGQAVRRGMIKLGCALAALGMAGASWAQSYPSKPIRLIVPFPAGGPADLVARVIGKELGDSLGQQVIIDNRGGGNTIIAAEIAARSAPDGYTLFQAIDSTLTMNQALYKKLPYDPIKDFAPVSQVASLPLLLVVNSSLPVNSVKDLTALAKSKTGGIYYAAGTLSSQLAGELLKSLVKVDMVHVPYKGSAPAVQGLLSGEVQTGFDVISTTSPHIKTGKLRPLAVTGEKRDPAMPNVPTVQEAGVPGFKVVLWHGIVVPTGTPPEIVRKLNTEINNILAKPGVKEKFATAGISATGSTPEQFASVIKSDSATWGKLIKETGIQLD